MKGSNKEVEMVEAYSRHRRGIGEIRNAYNILRGNLKGRERLQLYIGRYY
jgi:hypothetical protein